MSKEKTYDLFAGYKLLSEMWEKQLMDVLFKATDNKEFVRTANIGLDLHSRYMERLRKNQEFIAALMNIPTKKDVANAAKMSIQAEEKFDSLEEQVWNLQDGLASFSKENLIFLQEIINTINLMKAESLKTKEELAETKKIKTDLQDLRQGFVDIKILQVNLQEMRKELEGLKAIQAELKDSLTHQEPPKIDSGLEELRQEIAQLAELKREIASLKELMGNEKERKQKKEPEKELVLPGASTTK